MLSSFKKKWGKKNIAKRFKIKVSIVTVVIKVIEYMKKKNNSDNIISFRAVRGRIASVFL